MARFRELQDHDLMAEYLRFLAARRRPMTAVSYASDLRMFRVFLAEAGIQRKREIGPRLLDGYLIWLRGRGLEKSTVERRLQAVRSFFRWAVQRRYLRDDPFLVWEIPRAPEPLPKALTPGEDRRLLGLLDTFPKRRFDRMVAMGIRLGRFAGLRVGECGAQRWEDADLVKGALIVRDGKGGVDRAVPIPDAGLASPLRAWWEAEGRPDRGSVLTGLLRRPLAPKCLTRSVQRWFRAAQIAGVSFHVLRATYATRLLERGVPVTVIQRLLGHKDLRSTMRYLAVWDEGKREAVALLDLDLPEKDGLDL